MGHCKLGGLYVSYCLDKSELMAGLIYVQNLPANFDDACLRKEFERYGSIRACKTFPHERYGRVFFESPDAAENAASDMNGKLTIEGIALRVVRPTTSRRFESTVALDRQWPWRA